MGNNHTKTDGEQRFEQIPGEIPVLALYNTVIYPDISMPIAVSDQASIKLIEETLAEHKVLGVVTQKSGDTEELTPENLYSVGAVIKLLKMFRTPEGESVCPGSGSFADENHGVYSGETILPCAS